MRVLACDFDGVLCDSSREVFVVAADAYAAKEPDSPLLPTLARLRAEAFTLQSGYLSDPLVESFFDLLPLGNRAEDFGVALHAIESGQEITDQAAYDRFYALHDFAWLENYHFLFYKARVRLRTEDLATWLGLHRPYPGLAETLSRHTEDWRMAILTAKDKESVGLILAELGMAELFARDLILDKDTGVEKTRHLEVLRDRLDVTYLEITFIDDKVNHLRRAAALGVRPVLSAWGFNTERELSLASQLGYEIADLSTAEAVLFKGDG